GRPFCLFVDDLIGKQEVVIKSLGQRFKSVAEVAGCAILGDGRVGLILDIDGIYRGEDLVARSIAGIVDSIPVLNDREFAKISQLAYEHSGLDLRAGKQGLVAAR